MQIVHRRVFTCNTFRFTKPSLRCVSCRTRVCVPWLTGGAWSASRPTAKSSRKAKLVKGWEYVQKALDKDEVIEGFVKRRTKGGLIVDVFGIEAFLPGSQIDVKPIRDYDAFVNKTMEFKVVKINNEFKNVVVSHKALIEAEIEMQKREIIGKLEK